MIKLNRALLLAPCFFAAVAAPHSVGSPQHTDSYTVTPLQSKPAADQKAAELTPERVSVEPDANRPADFLRWSPDGSQVAWMHLVRSPANSRRSLPQQEIWSLQSKSGIPDSSQNKPVLLVPAATVTASLRRTGAPEALGLEEEDKINPFLLSDFAWSNDHASLLLIGRQSLSWLEISSGKFRVLVSGDQTLADAALSPDGRFVSFIRDRSLCLVGIPGDRVSGPVRVLARSTNNDQLEGEPDWPYRNELHLSRAYQWSPDSSRIAYLETDDRSVAKYPLRSSDGDTREIAYPKPGGEIPLIRVFVKRASATEAPVEMNFGPSNGYYVPRIRWLPDGRRLAIERLDRRQHTLDLFLADALTGKTRLLFTEKDDYWINLSDDLYFLKDGNRFLWSSERSGFRHIYLYNTEGNQLAQLTSGNWEVTRIDSVIEKGSGRASIYFTATEKNPLERHLYRINLDKSGMTRITQQPGTHEILFAPNGAGFVDRYSSQTSPPRLSFHSLAAPEEAGSASEAAPSFTTEEEAPLPPLQPVELFTLKMHMGAEVHTLLIKPPAFDPTKKYPAIVYFAGGPGEQLVRDAWGGAIGLWMQLMAQKGYIIFALDNQGTAARGHNFEEPIHMRLGSQEMSDQRDGLAYLKNLPYVDTTRLGACGWGYGGFLVVHAMLDRPVAYRAGFAGAPIVDWHFYDAVFSERYLDDPVVHADGWQASTALENSTPRFFKGSLLIAQGTEDEFVHIENTLTLQDRLLDEGKSADILLFPDRGHQIDDPPSRLVLFIRMTDFFLNNL